MTSTCAAPPSPPADVGDRPAVVMIGADDVATRPGGLGRYAEALAHALGDVPLVVLGPGRPDAGVIGVSSPDDGLVRRVVAVARAVSRLDPEVIDVHFALYGLAPVLTRRGRGVIAHHHGPWAAEAATAGALAPVATWLRNAVEAAVLRRAHTVVTLSDHFRRAVVGRHGLFPARVVTIPPGADCGVPGDPAAARRRLGVDDATPLVVTVRRLVPRTGVDLVVEAWARIVDEAPGRWPPGRLVVGGDGPEAPRLRAAVEAAGLGDSVTLAGPLRDQHLRDLWAAADVAVVPSRALEGFGLVVLEAACQGTASIVTDVGGLPEAVRGLGDDLVVGATSTALARRITTALDGTAPLPPRATVREWAGTHRWSDVASRHREIHRRAAAAAKRPRVVFVLHTARPSGGELALARMLEAGPGFDAHVVSLEHGPVLHRLESAGVTTEVVPMPPTVTGVGRSELSAVTSMRLALTAGRSFAGLAGRLRELRPDVVVATSLKSGLLCSAARPAVPGRFVWSLTDDLGDPDYPPIAVRLARTAARRADATLSNSAATRRSWGLAPSDRHVVVTPGHARRRAPVPEPEGAFRVAMVGRLAPWKGQDVFVEAFARAFPRGGPATEAVISGAAMFGESEFEERLRRRCAAEELDGRVHFTGHVDDPDEVFDAASVVVHASTRPEPFGQVVVEAMAAGRPVVATAAGGVAEIVTDGVDGLLVPPGDVEALVAALVRLREDATMRRRLGRRAVARADDFSIDETARATTALLSDIAESGRQQRSVRRRGSAVVDR